MLPTSNFVFWHFMPNFETLPWIWVQNSGKGLEVGFRGSRSPTSKFVFGGDFDTPTLNFGAKIFENT